MVSILLNKNRSKTSTNVNNAIKVDLLNKQKLLPVDGLKTTINEVDLYDNERLNSNIIRLTCAINPICSNVLFNNITEIVINEGSDKCECLNYTPLSDMGDNYVDNLIYKGTNHFSKQIDAIRDTQLSNDANGFIYHCGLDIFNNHIIRNNTFKTVCKLTGGTNSDFNTIFDGLRDIEGRRVSGYSDAYSGTPSPDIPLHLYLADDIMSFKDCVTEKLIDINGWFGFTNLGKFGTYKDNELYDIYKVINYQKPCDFIDMYPSRDLWSFTPKYNNSRKRNEKNWNYCLTYPSSSTTEVDFIRPITNTLRATMFDDTIDNYIGTSGLKIYSISKHGLKKGDYVNIYKSDTVIIRNAEVLDTENDFIFTIYDNGVELSKSWKTLNNNELKASQFEVNGITYKISQGKNKYAYNSSDNTYKFPILPNNRVNLDSESLDISYKRVVDGEEVDYYVRIFSRLPNWKFSETKPTEYEMYKDNQSLIKKYRTIEYEFENHISKLAFAKNIYKDDISEIVFTDNIDISGLKDNLGRPLTSIYLTIIKNNKGYREWYGIQNGKSLQEAIKYGIEPKLIEPQIKSDSVEYSHCFGKITCGFELSKESLWDDTLHNVLSINRVDNKKGLNVREYKQEIPIDSDEIQYNNIKYNNNDTIETYSGDTEFYGDLCSYSNKQLTEETIQQIEHRFNTMQRELIPGDFGYERFRKLTYDEIYNDDYDNLANYTEGNSHFEIRSYEVDNVCNRKEGYLYYPHYQIPIKTFSKEIKSEKPIYLTIKDVNTELKTIYTSERHYFNQNDKFILRIQNYADKTTKFIICEVDEVINSRKIKYKYNEAITNEMQDSILKYGKIIKYSDTIPQYATLSTEGSCIFLWREVIQNGFDTNNSIQQYPFVNGALYANLNINLFVRRQDPNNYSSLQSTTFPYDANSNVISTTEENNYYSEEDIEC